MWLGLTQANCSKSEDGVVTCLRINVMTIMDLSLLPLKNDVLICKIFIN